MGMAINFISTNSRRFPSAPSRSPQYPSGSNSIPPETGVIASARVGTQIIRAPKLGNFVNPIKERKEEKELLTTERERIRTCHLYGCEANIVCHAHDEANFVWSSCLCGNTIMLFALDAE
ncbi:hypothetical protein EVAR_76410_1 [Eumeta japonica]|uniref:Uncharacterized protein n=1 Tax=Eumeta variegata TaxID=151549 RepID=A0A4C1TAY0_EUMVA|nr:hypothetical protein EVAR_76410_1 [Eumeta japonica]